MSEKIKLNFKGIIKGILFSVITTIVLVVVLATISYFVDINDKILSLLLFLVSIFSVLIGAVFLSKTTSTKGLLHGVLLGMGYCLVVFSTSAIIKNKIEFTNHNTIMLFANLFSGALGGILGNDK